MKFIFFVTLLATIQGLAVNAAPALAHEAARISNSAVGVEEAHALDVSLSQVNTDVHA